MRELDLMKLEKDTRMRQCLTRIVAVLVLLLSISPSVIMAAPPAPAKPGDTSAAPVTSTLPPAAVLAKIEPLLLKELAQNPSTTYLVYMRAQANLAPAQAQLSKLSRRQTVVSSLQQTATASQASVLSFLEQQQESGNVSAVTSYWVFNGMAVTGDKETLLALAARPDVERILANHVHHLMDGQAQSTASAAQAPGAEAQAVAPGGADPKAVEWNIAQVRAPDVWNSLGITGQGIVVASLDTGVYLPHPALQRKYRGYNNGIVDNNYNWLDTTGTYANGPNDGHGHGTHTMGTMVGSEANGSNQIGVAPDAKWIAVKVFDDAGNTTDTELHAGFQWILAPTNLQGLNPDPSKAPDIVSNSWGDTASSDQSFWQDVLAWRAAGIMPVFAGGNAGPNAGTADSPGSYPQSFAVGATNINDVVANFSGRGPSPWGETKPEVTAPGVNVRSSVPPSTDPSLYQGGWSGTSMATPHAAAATALLWQARPELTITATEFALTSTSVPLPSQASSPNNDYGWGRIDLFQAVGAIMNGGRFWGRATDAVDGHPVSGASIVMTRQDAAGTAHTSTDAFGYYTMTVSAGLYQVTASDFWHVTQTVRDVPIAAGFTTIQDFVMAPRPSGVLRGQVTGGGAPVTATISVSNTPIIFATDAAGVYSVTIPADTYGLRLRPATGYRQAMASGVTISAGGQTVRDFDLVSGPRILLVDADAWQPGASQISYYVSDLDSLLYTEDLWQVMTFTGNLPPAATLSLYDVVIWHQPETSPGYIGAWPALASFMDNGGALFISGQDIGYWDDIYLGDNGASRTYYRGYLHALYKGDNAGFPGVLGLGGQIFTGLNLVFNTPDSAQNQTNSDAIAALDASATPVFSYTTGITTGGAGGLKIDPGAYQAIYLPFGLEASGPAQVRQQTLGQALAWLSLPALRKTVDHALAAPGQDVMFTLRLANHAASGYSGLSIADPLPLSLSYVDGSATGGLTYDAAHRRLQWQGAISAQSAVSFTFQASLAVLPGGASIVNTASMGASGGVSLPTSASVVVGAADLSSARKTASVAITASGQPITYSITLTNTGVGASAVTLTDQIPAGTTYVSGSVTGGASYNATLNRIEWTGQVTASASADGDYVVTTSDDPGGPAFNWVDISGVGTRLLVGDDTNHGPFSIGFPFSFYGVTYTQFYLNSNGWISFQPQSIQGFANVCLPDPSAPRPLIAMFWDDLNPTSGGVYYLSSSDTLVVSFVGVPRYSTGGPYTFQALLHPDGSTTYQYLDMQGTRLNEATAGVQDATGTRGLNLVCNDNFVHDNLAVRLVPASAPAAAPVIGYSVRANDGLPLFTTVNNIALAAASSVTYTLNASTTVNTMDLGSSAKSVDKALAGFGDSLMYTVVVTNTGTATGTASITDVLPVQVAYVPGSASNGAFYDAASRSVRWSGAVAPSASSTITFAATCMPGLTDNTLITNTVRIADPAGHTFLRSAVTRYRAADLSASRKEVVPSTVRVGDTVTFTITVANGGGGPTSFMVTDTLTASFGYVTGSLQSSHGIAGYDDVQKQIVWSGDTAGQYQAYLRFSAIVRGSGTLTNSALIQDAAGHIETRSAAVSAPTPTITPTITPTSTPVTRTPTPTATATAQPNRYLFFLPIIIDDGIDDGMDDGM